MARKIDQYKQESLFVLLLSHYILYVKSRFPTDLW